jgi:diacylglycerol O-acyltransferase / wax synthase
MERMTGPDAVMLHLERPTVPMHTLKIVVLDSVERGRPITLPELRAAVTPYLGLVPRATQTVVSVAGSGGRPYWVDDLDFDIDRHLDELTLAEPTRATFDALCARLAERHLDRRQPLWTMTLVHGLQDGHQAVVVRLHHAVSDGLGALNTFLAATTDRAGVVAPAVAARTARSTDRPALRRRARRELREQVARLPRLVDTGRHTRGQSRSFEAWDQVPGGLAAERTSFNTPGGWRRVCASGELELAELKEVARETGATINGVLHGVLASAMRAEYAARDEHPPTPSVAVFGVAADTRSSRRWGNEIAPATVFLHTQVADPLERLRATARSCLHAVDLRRRRGFELTDQVFTYVPRLMPALRAIFAPYAPKVVNNITTANVAGPQHLRWFGEVAVVDWISYAVAVAPADVNLTAYSYNGRLSIGLVATPEAMPDPARFLARLQPALDELRHALERERAELEVGAIVA